MKILGLLAILSWSQAQAWQVKICGFSETWMLAHADFSGKLEREDFENPSLITTLEVQSLENVVALPFFRHLDFDPLIAKVQEWNRFLDGVNGQIPLLRRYLVPEHNRISSLRLDRHSVGPVRLDRRTRCVSGPVLSLQKKAADIFVSGDQTLWERLSTPQKCVGLLFSLLENLLPGSLLSQIPTALATDEGLEKFYRSHFSVFRKTGLLAQDAHPLLSPKDLDRSEGRRDLLEDWLYALTPTILASHFAQKSNEDFVRDWSPIVIQHCRDSWRKDFAHLEAAAFKQLCEEAAGLVVERSLEWLRRFQKSGIALEEFENPYTLNSYWRGTIAPELKIVVIKHSRVFPFWKRLVATFR